LFSNKFISNKNAFILSVAELNKIKIPFLHINHLIKSKEATNRPKDMLDVIELKKIQEIRIKKS
jgi:hypothetical protein